MVINELMYSPNSGSPEWVEIYNRGKADVDLAGWFIQKGDTAGRRTLTSHSVVLGPGDYTVLSSDSLNSRGNHPTLMPIGGMISLKNEGDVVTITDSRGAVMDQVNYRPSWGGKTGISLERVSLHLPGRIWDTPIIGGGTYCDRNGGVSTTGHGETIMKTFLALRTVQLLARHPARTAARKAIDYAIRQGCRCGLVGIDRKGGILCLDNTKGMSWCWIKNGKLRSFWNIKTLNDKGG